MLTEQVKLFNPVRYYLEIEGKRTGKNVGCETFLSHLVLRLHL